MKAPLALLLGAVWTLSSWPVHSQLPKEQPATSGVVGQVQEWLLVARELRECGGDALPELEKTLKSKSADVRRGAALALDHVAGDWATPAMIRRLIALLWDKSDFVNETAFCALGPRSQHPGARSVRAAIQILEEPRIVHTGGIFASGRDSYLEAIELLRGAGPAANYAVPALRTAIRNEGRGGKVNLASALMADVGLTTTVLLAVARRQSIPVEEAALKAALTGGLGSKKTILVLLKLAQNRDEEFRFLCALVLAKTGVGVRQSLPDLFEELKDIDPAARLAALAVLDCLGPAAKDAAETIADLLFDPNSGVGKKAAQTLRVVDPATATKYGR